MHSFSGKTTYFNYNGDYSGEIYVVEKGAPFDSHIEISMSKLIEQYLQPHKEIIKIDRGDLYSFLYNFMMNKITKALEDETFTIDLPNALVSLNRGDPLRLEINLEPDYEG